MLAAWFILRAMKLYNYYRSSASFRVRIVLELKGLPYDYVPVNLLVGEQRQPSFRGIAADGMVPVLEDGAHHLSQSMAIMEYVDEIHPTPPLLPPDALGRAQVRALAQSIACEVHPLNNLRVLKYLVGPLQQDEAAKLNWYRHWAREGLEAFERQLQALDADRGFAGAAGARPSRFCFGDTPTLADCVLVPQIFNAQRFEVCLDNLPRTVAVFAACMRHPAFLAAQPSACPDFVA